MYTMNVAVKGVEAAGVHWTIRAFRDGESDEYYAVIYDRYDEPSYDYQLWIAPHMSTHPTPDAAMEEAEAAIVRAVENNGEDDD